MAPDHSTDLVQQAYGRFCGSSYPRSVPPSHQVLLSQLTLLTPPRTLGSVGGAVCPFVHGPTFVLGLRLQMGARQGGSCGGVKVRSMDATRGCGSAGQMQVWGPRVTQNWFGAQSYTKLLSTKRYEGIAGLGQCR